MGQYEKLISDIKLLWREYLQIDGNEAGGNLHIVIEDGNWNNGSCYFCLSMAVAKGDLLGEKLINRILDIPEQYRAKLLENG